MLGRFQYNGCLKLFDMGAIMGGTPGPPQVCATRLPSSDWGGHGVPPLQIIPKRLHSLTSRCPHSLVLRSGDWVVSLVVVSVSARGEWNRSWSTQLYRVATVREKCARERARLRIRCRAHNVP